MWIERWDTVQDLGRNAAYECERDLVVRMRFADSIAAGFWWSE
jgi:hypothetical protein